MSLCHVTNLILQSLPNHILKLVIDIWYGMAVLLLSLCQKHISNHHIQMIRDVRLGLEPARWYLLLQLFHRMLSWGWWYLYSRKHDDNWSFFYEDACDTADGTAFPAIDMGGDVGEESTKMDLDEFLAFGQDSREIFTRQERVRAKKAGEWISSEGMISSLARLVVGTTPNESYLHFLLKEHSEQTWTGQFGLHMIPCVQLCQPWKSPAFAILNEYWLLQTSSIRTALEILEGLPGIDWDAEETTFFQLLVDMSSCVWKRLARKHLAYPWRLAMLLDPHCSATTKENLLADFFGQNMCCLESGSSQDLKTRFEAIGVQGCLELGSSFMRLMVLMFSSKTTNVQLENDFARATTSRSYLHGQRHCASTMASKHLLAELKHQHLLALDLDKDAKKRIQKRQLEDNPRNSALPVELAML